MIRALVHRLSAGRRHYIWSEELIWPGGRGLTWFCTCGREFGPIGDPDYPTNTNIKRRPPEWG